MRIYTAFVECLEAKACREARVAVKQRVVRQWVLEQVATVAKEENTLELVKTCAEEHQRSGASDTSMRHQKKAAQYRSM
jgi:hypothetical protein